MTFVAALLYFVAACGRLDARARAARQEDAR